MKSSGFFAPRFMGYELHVQISMANILTWTAIAACVLAWWGRNAYEARRRQSLIEQLEAEIAKESPITGASPYPIFESDELNEKRWKLLLLEGGSRLPFFDKVIEADLFNTEKALRRALLSPEQHAKRKTEHETYVMDREKAAEKEAALKLELGISH